MKAIIPAAGEGTRLRPHTYSTPKAMLNVAGKPILGHIIDIAIDAGVDDIAFIIGYKGEKIREYVTSAYSKIKSSFYVQEEITGIASAVNLAKDYLGNEPVFIVLGDTIFNADLPEVFKSNHSSLGVQEVEDPRRFGTAELDNDGFVTQLVEKPQHPKTNLTLAGLYYIREGRVLAEAINELISADNKTRGEFQITDALQIMIDNGEKTKTFPLTGWYDCGKYDAILSTNQFLLSKSKTKYDHETSIIHDSVYIGDDVTLKNSIIERFTSISEGTVIENSIIGNSILGSNVKITNAVLKDSLIGNNAIVTGNHRNLNIGDNSEVSL
ncbi:MAG: NTP transferase domain-containing protein [bacterium]|nr:NTP transferase domain-containing protein [bacterium]